MQRRSHEDAGARCDLVAFNGISTRVMVLQHACCRHLCHSLYKLLHMWNAAIISLAAAMLSCKTAKCHLELSYPRLTQVPLACTSMSCV